MQMANRFSVGIGMVVRFAMLSVFAIACKRGGGGLQEQAFKLRTLHIGNIMTAMQYIFTCIATGIPTSCNGFRT